MHANLEPLHITVKCSLGISNCPYLTTLTGENTGQKIGAVKKINNNEKWLKIPLGSRNIVHSVPGYQCGRV